MIVLVITRQHFLQQMLIQALSADSGVVAASGSCHPAVDAAAQSHPPHLVVVDTAHPERFRQVSGLRARFPAVKVVVLAVSGGDEEVLAWAEIGVSGYVEPDTSTEQLILTLRRAAAGEVVCPPRLTALLLKRFSAPSTVRVEMGGTSELTRREFDVVKLVAQGLANKLIARQLQIAEATVKNHVHSILEKWNVRTRGEAAACYRRSESKDAYRFREAA